MAEESKEKATKNSEEVAEVEEELDPKAAKKKKQKEMEKAAKKKIGGLWGEFKKFITRGNVIDMSIGVVIGGAFGAIVTAVTNIFLSVCTWAVPGGLSGLVTVLPSTNGSNVVTIAGTEVSRSFLTQDLDNIVSSIVSKGQVSSIDSARSQLLSQFTLHGSLYVYNGAAIIDWGAVINAAISFIIIALILFIIVKSFTALNKARINAQLKAKEEYYKKHPDERPVPPKPGQPELTERELLKEILITLKSKDAKKEVKKK